MCTKAFSQFIAQFAVIRPFLVTSSACQLLKYTAYKSFPIFKLYLAKEGTSKVSYPQVTFTGSEEEANEAPTTDDGSFENSAS